MTSLNMPEQAPSAGWRRRVSGWGLTWVAAAALASLALLGAISPAWLNYLLTMSAGYGLVSLGIVALMRGGTVSFGQGAAFAAGGYAAAWLSSAWGVRDALLLVLGGGLVSVLVALPFSWLLARYRGIFFATLTLALSMVAYGLLSKSAALGGSDGLNVPRPTLLGLTLDDAASAYALYLLSMAVAVGMAVLARVYFRSEAGLTAMAVRDNEIRLSYLGGSVFRVMVLNHLFAALCGGLGGALVVISLGHVEPQFSYWTTSGEFVFVAVLAGSRSVPAVFLAAVLLEVIRSFSGAYFPTVWQLVLGTFLLVVIRFLPQGIGSLWARQEGQP